ncbi:MAG TPA: sulfotransferase domain-containing protein [Thiobacillaceae bacterium]|nr:sulfotransferase domain-containing protein [Thiobacillaceae bacterium]HNI06699.1 sulfotransferase domain-containing protein [Thiobacillaceae bacterium]
MPEEQWQSSSTRPVLFSSYPKTGSTVLPSLLDRWLRTHPGAGGEMFTWGKGKHNFLIHGGDGVDTLVVKSHDALADVLARIRKTPGQLAWLFEALQKQEVDFFTGRECSIVYMLRNPVAVLFSAINYAKLLYDRDELRNAWLQDGRAERFFIDMLGLKAIPGVDEYRKYAVQDLPGVELEGLLWRYIDAWGSIPIFDPVESFGYFKHVNYYSMLMARTSKSCLLSYEGMMANDPRMLASLADLLGIPAQELSQAWEAEQRDRSAGRGRYDNAFFRNFHLATPEPVKSLAAWPRMRRRLLDHCPALAEVTD